jgi:hypothetical protein
LRGGVFIFVLLFCCSLSGLGQGWIAEENNIETNWSVTLQIGPSMLINEVHKDFSGPTNDMGNKPNLAYNILLSKMVWERGDLGFEAGFSNYSGDRGNSSSVNYVMRSKTFNNEQSDFLPFSIYYKSDAINFGVFAKYNFINFSSFTKGFYLLNMYVRAGIGMVMISSEMGYSEMANYELTGLTHPLFAKGRYSNSNRGISVMFSPAFGMNYQLSDRFFISAEISTQILNVDYIDGVYNFNSQLSPDIDDPLPKAYRDPVFDVTGKFMVGVTYFFNFDSQRQDRLKVMPFYSNRYRSYYSKFQKQSTKRARKLRLPFYNDNFGRRFRLTARS